MELRQSHECCGAAELRGLYEVNSDGMLWRVYTRIHEKEPLKDWLKEQLDNEPGWGVVHWIQGQEQAIEAKIVGDTFKKMGWKVSRKDLGYNKNMVARSKHHLYMWIAVWPWHNNKKRKSIAKPTNVRRRSVQ